MCRNTLENSFVNFKIKKVLLKISRAALINNNKFWLCKCGFQQNNLCVSSVEKNFKIILISIVNKLII